MRSRRWLIFAILPALLFVGWPVIGGLHKHTQPRIKKMLPSNGIGQLRDGDILFRRGKEAVSEVVLGLDPQSAFSHVGIVVIRTGEAWVVHMVPAEAEGEDDAVKLEPVSRYLAADRSTGMAVYRLHELPDNSSASRLKIVVREALRLAQIGIPFDKAFNLDTQDRLYCTELVWQAFLKAGIDLAPNPPSKRFLLWSGRYIPPSTLQVSPHLKRVCC